MKYFEPVTGFFYDSEISTEIPESAIEISDELFTTVFAGQNEGKAIVSGKNGLPENAPQPPSAFHTWDSDSDSWVLSDAAQEQWHKQNVLDAENQKKELMSAAEAIIAPLSRAKSLGIATQDELSRLEAWEIYSVLLSRVDVSKAPDVDWPEKPEE